MILLGELANRDPAVFPDPDRAPTLRMAADLADIPFKYDAVIYGVYELPVTW